MTTLNDYITQTRRLLHDVSANFWTNAELTDYINEARSRTVSDTGCLRSLQTPIFQQGTENYVFGGLTGANIISGGTGFTNGTYSLGISGGGGTGAAGTYTCASGSVSSITITTQGTGFTSSPTLSFPSGGGINASATAGYISANTLDVMSVVIIWGNFRIPLGYMPFTELTAKLRMWTTWQQRPAAFSVFGQQNLYIGPLPDQIYVSEMDSILLPNTLVSLTDIDTIAYPYTSPVPYYAAHLAKLKEQSYNEAEMHRQMYKKRAIDAIGQTFTRRAI
jgi:hypothetical protein